MCSKIINKSKIDMSNIKIVDVKKTFPQFKEVGCYQLVFTKHLFDKLLYVKKFFIGLGKKCDENIADIVLNHEVIHSVLFREEGKDTSDKFDNISPIGDLIENLFESDRKTVRVLA